MSSYFQRLIHQTGIRLGNVPNVEISELAPKPPVSSNTEPIEVSERLFIDRDPATRSLGEINDSQIASPSQSLKPAADSNSIHHADNSSDQEFPENKLGETERGFSNLPSNSLIEVGEYNAQKTPNIMGIDITDRVGIYFSRDLNKVEETYEKKMTSLNDESHIPLQNTESSEIQIESSHSRQSRLNDFDQILEWVNGNPSSKNFSEGTSTRNEGAHSAGRPIQNTEKHPPLEPEIQDFQFSIGSVNLTIEEPKEQYRPAPLNREHGPSQSSTRFTGSRLRRHYLRY